MRKRAILIALGVGMLLLSMCPAVRSQPGDEYPFFPEDFSDDPFFPEDFSDDPFFPEESDGFFGFSFGFVIAIGAVTSIIHLIVLIWLYKDAERRGESGVLWLLVGLIAGIIGLIIWLIVRPKEKKSE